MKTGIHPNWYPEAKVTCGGCGATFTVGSTAPEMHVEVCSNCHPVYTGEAKFIDTRGRVDRFLERVAKKSKSQISKRDKRLLARQRKIKEELERPESLEELRKK